MTIHANQIQIGVPLTAIAATAEHAKISIMPLKGDFHSYLLLTLLRQNGD